ncbi:hypothetical protein HF650_16760 [Kosakonia sp. SMBL-WEM22]|uniref:hypothetical protein n=1 Tax=Kosakonia sp. SMBL-WEM22 TaxID=2725560 RepID=UPI001658E6A6|nr:hypothetical protein [Kosakonia sp. SMBL-WEM22]QNQ21268.1 hypothetical protein HF650_16760 [Kosakonia sp. SMBL-WEM22]
MKYLFFSFFLLTALLYIWNGKDMLSKKEWKSFLLKIALVIPAAMIWGVLLAFTLKFFPALGYDNMLFLSIIFPLSILGVLFSKLLVVLLCTIFTTILQLHENHNTQENYSKIASIFRRWGPKVLIAAKCLSSLGAVMVFYGIWLTDVA